MAYPDASAIPMATECTGSTSENRSKDCTRTVSYTHLIYGQYIYVNRRERVVIVMWGAQPKPTNKETIENQDFFAAATEALR